MAIGRFKLTNVPDDIVFDCQASDDELVLSVVFVLNVTFVVGLTASLWVED